ncbi:hypothetical protein PHAVU_010G020000 [Phaseolus vulgaris]
MDYNNNDGGASREPWGWQGANYSLGKTSDFEISEDLWNDVPQNKEDLSYMLDDETTPVKACGDLAYNVNNDDSNNMEKEVEECRETYSQAKRRRMLQFNSQDSDQSLSNEEMSLSYLQNGKEDPVKDIFPEVSQWMSGASDYPIGNASASDYVNLESTETWLAEYFNDAEMDFSPDELNFSGADDVQIDVAVPPSHHHVKKMQFKCKFLGPPVILSSKVGNLLYILLRSLPLLWHIHLPSLNQVVHMEM